MKTLRPIIALVTVVAVLALVPLTASPAHAAKGHCPAGAFCIWRDTSAETNGRGTDYVSFQRYIPNYGGWNYRNTRYNANNSATSFFNNGQANAPYSDVYLFKENSGNGALWRVSKGSYYWNLALQTVTWNDEITSGYFYKWSPRTS